MEERLFMQYSYDEIIKYIKEIKAVSYTHLDSMAEFRLLYDDLPFGNDGNTSGCL